MKSLFSVVRELDPLRVYADTQDREFILAQYRSHNQETGKIEHAVEYYVNTDGSGYKQVWRGRYLTEVELPKKFYRALLAYALLVGEKG